MYGLPQAWMLANELLTQWLVTRGFYPCQFTPGLWWHAWQPITFILIVDDFGIKYTALQHTQYLMESPQQDYNLDIDWSGILFCGITLTWDYTKQTVNLSMPAYIAKALTKLQDLPPSHPEHFQHKHNPIKYGVWVPLPKSNAPSFQWHDANMYKKLWIHDYTTLGLWTPHWHVLKVPLLQSKQMVQTSVLATCHHILDYVATLYVAMPAKWY